MGYLTKCSSHSLIHQIELGVNDAFRYADIMDELTTRAMNGELTAFQFLVGQGLNNNDLQDTLETFEEAFMENSHG